MEWSVRLSAMTLLLIVNEEVKGIISGLKAARNSISQLKVKSTTSDSEDNMPSSDDSFTESLTDVPDLSLDDGVETLIKARDSSTKDFLPPLEFYGSSRETPISIKLPLEV
ncbi:hypothetical protein DPMN_086368 [Dreissena polymorpha]|uniref:Uncharacterized protein n=1 Tax=Dreissena polymorpha TaxID=45954 RepID=A0A9D4KQR5_DREPO|nr:hypothetical protein DPMN_086368 [Dreissena polymorpha]